VRVCLKNALHYRGQWGGGGSQPKCLVTFFDVLKGASLIVSRIIWLNSVSSVLVLFFSLQLKVF